jgi:hypothetical protein
MTSVSSASTKSEQIRIRIKLSVAAYAYEKLNTEIMSDGDYDKLSREVDLSVKTGSWLDAWFEKNYSPDTGQWINKHPDLKGIANIYERYYNKEGKWYYDSTNNSK